MTSSHLDNYTISTWKPIGARKQVIFVIGETGRRGSKMVCRKYAQSRRRE
jgi:hypothetical protein